MKILSAMSRIGMLSGDSHNFINHQISIIGRIRSRVDEFISKIRKRAALRKTEEVKLPVPSGKVKPARAKATHDQSQNQGLHTADETFLSHQVPS